MVFSVKKEEKEKVSVQEAFSMWEVLKGKYDALEQFGIYNNLAQNPDLKIATGRVLKLLKKHKERLELMLRKYAVPGPDQGMLPSNWSGNQEMFRDEFIASSLLQYLNESLENNVRAMRDAVFNDSVRSVYIKMIDELIDEKEIIIKHNKLRGWVATPPLYKRGSVESKEDIDLAGVARLWEHLSFRYASLWQTKIYQATARDGDLRILLGQGLNMLEKQVAILEKECAYFGISLSQRPAEVIVSSPAVSEVFTDERIYRELANGQQGAVFFHVEAVNQCVTNDRLSAVFIDLIKAEVDSYDKLVKYGKIKQWLKPMPLYYVLMRQT